MDCSNIKVESEAGPLVRMQDTAAVHAFPLTILTLPLH